MGTYLITSRSGTGKSTICRQLQVLGHPAFDGDEVPRLARWIDTATGLAITMDYRNPVIDRERYHWEWDEAVLKRLLTGHKHIFLCGSADNQQAFHKLFDQVFVLTLSPDEQRRRILARTSHNYGKHPTMQEQIVREQQVFVTQALRLGAVTIDASPSSKEVTRTILEQTGL